MAVFAFEEHLTHTSDAFRPELGREEEGVVEEEEYDVILNEMGTDHCTIDGIPVTEFEFEFFKDGNRDEVGGGRGRGGRRGGGEGGGGGLRRSGRGRGKIVRSGG